LGAREKCFSVKVCCKWHGIADRSVTTLFFIGKLRFSDVNGCWEKFSPEIFKDFWEFHTYQKAIKKILMVGREVPEGFPGVDEADMQIVQCG
jgi:hypothetical protein